MKPAWIESSDEMLVGQMGHCESCLWVCVAVGLTVQYNCKFSYKMQVGQMVHYVSDRLKKRTSD